MVKTVMLIKKLVPFIIGCLMLGSLPVLGQGLGNQSEFSPENRLYIPHGVVDPSTGDLLIISNSWRNSPVNLRRFSADGEADDDFVLQRFEACCAVRPVLVAVGPDDSIYTMEFTGSLGGWYIYKHAPNGELDIDWGQREGVVDSLTPLSSTGYASGAYDSDDSPSGFDEGETSLDWNAGGGRFHFNFGDPIDITVLDDHSVLVLDRLQRYVYRVLPDGRSIEYFIGRDEYFPRRPQRMFADSLGYVYLVDYYDEYDINRADEINVFKFDSDGEWILGWGEFSGGINDQWGPDLDISTLVIDGSDNIICLGSEFGGITQSEVFVYDHEAGSMTIADRVQYRMGGSETDYLGIMGRPEGGFIVLDGWGFQIQVNYYTIDGIRESQVRIDDLYDAE